MSSPITWLARHLQALLSALGRLLRAPLGTLLTVLVIAIALILPTGLWVIVANARAATNDLTEVVTLTVFLNSDESLQSAKNLELKARTLEKVGKVNLISADEGLKEFREYSGLGTVLDIMKENPLPHVLVIQPNAQNTDHSSLELLRVALTAWPEVDTVQFDSQWARRLEAILNLLQQLFFAVAALLALGVLAVIGNTVRLEIMARRTEIEVTKLVGGSNAFVRRPFLYLGLLYGLMGSLLALALGAVILVALEAPIGELGALYGSTFRLSGLNPEEALRLVLIGGGLGILGAWVGAARHLAKIEPRQ